MRAGYVFSEVLTGLRRNITMTIAMILTTAISLGMLGGGLIVAQMTEDTRGLYGDKVQLSVYLTPELSVEDPDCKSEVCASLLEDLKSNPEVESVDFQSQAAALEQYKKQFAGQPEMLDIVQQDALSAYLRVRLHQPERFAVIADEFEKRPGVQSISDQREFIEKLFGILNGIRNATIVIALVQAIAAVLLISNMVQIAAYTRRTEISIMRLVGASRWRTQLPFMIEAIVAGIIGAALAIVGLYVAKSFLVDGAFGSILNSGVVSPIKDSTMLVVSYGLAGIGAALAAVSAYITLRLYVRV